MTALDPKPRLMFLVTDLARGGAETQVALLAVAMRRRGWDVDVVSLLEPTAFVENLERENVVVSSLGMRPGRPSLRGLLRLVSILQRRKPGILHAHLFHANLLARLIRLICPVPVVISTIHSLAESGRGSDRVSVRDWIYRVTDWLSERSVCVSGVVADRYSGSRAVAAKRLGVIPNGVEVRRFVDDEVLRARMRESLGLGDEFVWLAVGRLMWKKDYATMLGAFARQGTGVLLIAGEGPLEGELRSAARGQGDRVRFLGLREDVAALMNAVDGMVLSSVVEGLPMVLIEAAAAGLPCVATEVGGVREVVLEGETGFVVPPANVDALAMAMRGLAEMPAERRREMGEVARAHAANHFDIDTIAARWERLYLEQWADARLQRTP